MSFAQRMNRWNPLIATASKRFGIPASWLRAVMQLESGGRTMLAENRPIVSSMGAMGLMQLMPETWRTMRAQLGLGNDPYDPRDNIFAAAAYLSWLKSRYGYPNMFAAYNDGPRNLEARLFDASLLPRETRNYLARITGRLDGTTDVPRPPKLVRFTQPDGTPLWIDVGTSPDVSVREAAPGEYPPGVRSVVTVGRRSHGVWENVVMAQYRIASHGRTAGGPGAQAASLD
ncbi:MAG TPA: lytic transglycosylase domain-containing protein [Rhizomicrobium sp.]|nr:lytic transglycosylase domain-containing protein [Rhizomicrobium sp.]